MATRVEVTSRALSNPPNAQFRLSDLADLLAVRDRNIEDLSGGELQRFACAVVCIQRADV